MNNIYITASGIFLPNQKIANEEMEDYLGLINGKKSVAKDKILGQNGIKTRYYAIDKNQNSTHSNAKMAALAAENAISKSSLKINDIELLCTGTTQADLPVPGFASMVHAELDIPNCEIAGFQSVCASGLMAIKNAYCQLKSGEKSNALVIGSEFSSRLFKASRFEAQKIKSVPFDTEFLRWMLSDGAGALLLQNKKAATGLSLSIEWIDIKSYANKFPLCMYAGTSSSANVNGLTWLDYPDFESASQAGAINLKQDIRLLDQVVKTGVAHYFELIDKHKINPGKVDWLCCHYSSEFFKEPIKQLMRKGGAEIPDQKWFSNMATKGNTGSASIFIMLEELMYSGKLEEGQTILCMVPESGRFVTSFMLLRVEGSSTFPKKESLQKVESPELVLNKTETSEWLVRQLAQVWIDFETQLYKVPIVKKIHNGNLSLEDYKLLLTDLRQQVIDGSQWISRAASNIDIELFDLRSAFIKHTAAEHKDYHRLEKNDENLGEDSSIIRSGQKNIGSVALTSFMFQQASKSNPIDLLGAMFIIEGIGKRLASNWGELMRAQLNLNENQVSFFTYHGVADENHFKNLEQALNHPMLDMNIATRIVKTAKITAKLYKMQLEELGNY